MPSPVSKRPRPPLFCPVPLRARADGWSAERQCGFLAHLYLTGSVLAAARAVGMTRETAYRLRRRADAASFAAAWDRVMGAPSATGKQAGTPDWRKVTDRELEWRVRTGLWQPVIYRGRLTAIRRKPCNSALLRLLRRMDARLAQPVRGRPAA